MLELFKIAGKIDLEGADKANKSLEDVDKKAGGLGSKIGGTAKKVAKGGALIGGAFAGVGTAAFAMVNKVTSSFDDIAKTSTKLGVSTDALQEMDYWAGQNGISSETMERGIGRLNQRMGRAAAGNEKYTDALKNLGINMDEVKDGTLSTEEAMGQSIKALSEMSTEQEKSAAASELFGTKMARDLMPALQDGSLSLEDAKKKAQELGIVIDEDTLAASEKFQDSWDNITRSLGVFGQKIMAELIPHFQGLMDWVLDNMPAIQSVISKSFEIVSGTISTVVGWVQSLISRFRELFASNEETMSGIWSTIQDTFNQIVSFLQDSLAKIRQFWKENGERILNNVKTVFQTTFETIQSVLGDVKDIITTVLSAVVDIVSEYLDQVRQFWEENGEQILENAIETFESIRSTVETALSAVNEIIQEVLGLIVPFIQEQLARIMEFWEQNGEQIMQAVDNAFSFIQGVIEFVMPVIQRIIKEAWNIIESVFDAAVGIIMGIVKTLASLLTGDFEGIKEGLTQIWQSLWDGIQGIVSGAWGLLSGAFEALWEQVSGWFGDLKDSALEWGGNMIDGFIDGIKSKIEAVGSAVNDVADAVGDFIGFNSPSKKGPGRNIVKWGRNMIEGFLDGVREKGTDAGKVMEQLVTTIKDAADNVGESLYEVGEQLMQKIVDGMESVSDDVSNTVKRATKSSSGSSGGGSSSGSGGKNLPGSSSNTLVKNSDGSYGTWEEKYHDGGWIGKAIAGLKQNERPIIGEDGEFVLSKKMIRNSQREARKTENVSPTNTITQHNYGVQPGDVQRETERALRRVATNLNL